MDLPEFSDPPMLSLSAAQATAAAAHLTTLFVCVWGARRIAGQSDRRPRPWAVYVWMGFWLGGFLMHGIAVIPGAVPLARWLLIARDLGMVFLPVACYAVIRWVIGHLQAKNRTIARLRHALESREDPDRLRGQLRACLNDLTEAVAT